MTFSDCLINLQTICKFSTRRYFCTGSPVNSSIIDNYVYSEIYFTKYLEKLLPYVKLTCAVQVNTDENMNGAPPLGSCFYRTTNKISLITILVSIKYIFVIPSNE